MAKATENNTENTEQTEKVVKAPKAPKVPKAEKTEEGVVEKSADKPKAKPTEKTTEKKAEKPAAPKKAAASSVSKAAVKPAAKTSKPVMMKPDNAICATGRRKTSVARVRLVKGKGAIIVNGKAVNEYFPAGVYEMVVRQPLEVTNFKNDYDIKVNVYGGGLSGQAGAIRLGISRALDIIDPTNHSALKANKFFTRDPRMVERKKFGRKKARKRFQFSKR